MINLRLAEYDLKTGKFEQFFNLGLNDPYSFGFYGDTITVYYSWIGESFSYDLDEKDPLNRFNGLFDGRTYGKGRFVLITNYQDNIYRNIKHDGYEDVFIYTLGTEIEANFIEPENLHENPELYEKINK